MTGGVLATDVETLTVAIAPVQAQQSGTVQVSAPVLISGPTTDPSGTTLIGLLSFDSTTIQSNISGGSATLPQGNRDLQVGLKVSRPAIYPAGAQPYEPYIYRVTIAATVSGFTQTKDVEFSVTVTPACTFTNASNGELQLPNNNLSLLQTKTDAQVDLQCNSAANLKLDPPANISGPASLNTATLTAAASFGGTTLNSTGSAARVFGSHGGIGRANISMQVNNNSAPIPPGTYQFKVTLTATPQ